ncbi:condensation domain-containing protein, partial [Edaphobacter dinghuensis]
MHLDTMPLTPNGKLDRKALPAPEKDAYTTQAYEPPQGEAETVLAQIWEELLHVDRIGRHDNFFELGGHSLLAVQVVQYVRQLGFDLEIRALFATPKLADLAASLHQTPSLSIPPNLIQPNDSVIRPEMLPLIDLTQQGIDRIVRQVPGSIANIQDIYALSPLQEGILFHHLMAHAGDPYLIRTFLSFASRALLDRFLFAVQQIVDRHDILRTSFIWEGLSAPAQVVWRQAKISVVELELDPAAGPIADQLASYFDPKQDRIDLATAPLLRFVVAHDPAQDRWLAMQLMHHLIGDQSTLHMLRQEVAAFLAGGAQSLSPSVPFRNLVAQARLGVTVEEHERFFRQMLGDITEPTLAFGITDVYQDGSSSTATRRMLPRMLNDRLRRQARRLQVSLASLCHLAWAQVLTRITNSDTVVFGTVLFGRMHGEGEDDKATGLFINTLPIRFDLGNIATEAAVRLVQSRLSELLMHEHASLALAQRGSSIEAQMPLFNTVFDYRHSSQSLGSVNTNALEQDLSGIEVLGNEIRNNYPISLSVDDFGNSLGLDALITQSLFPERICDYMQQALESLADALETDPETPVRKLEVVPLAERKLLLETWNATEAPYADSLCIHQLFEEQVRKNPDAKALIFK